MAASTLDEGSLPTPISHSVFPKAVTRVFTRSPCRRARELTRELSSRAPLLDHVQRVKRQARQLCQLVGQGGLAATRVAENRNFLTFRSRSPVPAAVPNVAIERPSERAKSACEGPSRMAG